MITSQESLTWYHKADALWEEASITSSFHSREYEKICIRVASKAVKAMWRKEMGRKFPYKIKEGSGNRYTWVRGSVLTINTSRGWANIVHDFGHWLGYRKNFNRPHCADHAIMEYRLVKFVLDKGYIAESRESLTAVKKPRDLVVERYQRMLKRETEWAKKAKAAETYLTRVQREIRKYERVHGERLNLNGEA